MGDRGQIKIGDVYLYTHWDGSNLKQTLKRALEKQWRWDDIEYLPRIIFEEMIGKEKGTETGFGIGTIQHGDLDYPLIIVDVDNKTIIEGKEELSFRDFIEKEV